MEMYDGPRHQALKGMALTAFDLRGHRRLPAGDAGAAGARRWPGWRRATSGRRWRELRKLAIEALCRNVLGLDARPETEAISRDYGPDAAGAGVGAGGAARDAVRAGPGRPRSPAGHPAPDHRRAPARPRATTPCRASCRRGRPTGARSPTRRRCWRCTTSSSAGYIVYALMAEGLRRLAEDPALLARARPRCRRRPRPGR